MFLYICKWARTEKPYRKLKSADQTHRRGRWLFKYAYSTTEREVWWLIAQLSPHLWHSYVAPSKQCTHESVLNFIRPTLPRLSDLSPPVSATFLRRGAQAKFYLLSLKSFAITLSKVFPSLKVVCSITSWLSSPSRVIWIPSPLAEGTRVTVFNGRKYHLENARGDLKNVLWGFWENNHTQRSLVWEAWYWITYAFLLWDSLEVYWPAEETSRLANVHIHSALCWQPDKCSEFFPTEACTAHTHIAKNNF